MTTSRIIHGFTLVELLVVIAIIGILVSLLLPAVNSAREAGRRTQCINNMRQMALATTNHESSFRAYPPSRLELRINDFNTYCAGREPAWYARILPFMEEAALAAQWELYDDFANHPESLRNTIITGFVCPTRRRGNALVAPNRSYETEPAPCGCGGEWFQIGGALGDYGAVHGDPSPATDGGENNFSWGGLGTGILISSRAKCEQWTPTDWIDRVRVRHISDGLSKTLLIGEMHIHFKELGFYPFDGPIFDGDVFQSHARIGGPGFPIASGANDVATDFLSFGSWHPGGCNFALADGSVRALSAWLDTTVLGNLCHRSDGNIVNLEN